MQLLKLKPIWVFTPYCQAISTSVVQLCLCRSQLHMCRPNSTNASSVAGCQCHHLSPQHPRVWHQNASLSTVAGMPLLRVFQDARSAVLQRNYHNPAIQFQFQKDLVKAKQDLLDEKTSNTKLQGFFLNLSKKVLWLLAFGTGVTIGGALKVAYDSGVFGGAASGDSLQLIDKSAHDIIPIVKAAKGFNYTQNTDEVPDETSNNDSASNNNNDPNTDYKGFFNFGGKGSHKKPLKHRANFNFIADVVERLSPSVVYIEITDLRRRDRDGRPVAINNGSGFVVSSDGLILTNAHVVTNRPHASRVVVRLQDGREFEGVLEHVDALSDLALLRVKANDLIPAPLGESSTLRPGEFVVAVGSPLSLSNTVTAGVVSSTARQASDLGIRANDIAYIQTDAAITFGNSGGPLANLDGDVIGINSMKAAAGISFAIPVDIAKAFLADAAASRELRKSQSNNPDTAPKRRRYLGITMLSLTPDIIGELQSRLAAPLPSDLSHGVLVWRVVIGSPAYHAGLQPGDVVTEINGHQTRSAADVHRLLDKTSDLTMVVHRGNNRYTVTVTPEE